MSEKTRSIIDYIIACVNEFSDTRNLDTVFGFDYLREHGGLEFLERNYDIEHTYPIEGL